MPFWVGSLMQGSISQPWGHDLNWNQESTTQPTEHPIPHTVICYIFIFIQCFVFVFMSSSLTCGLSRIRLLNFHVFRNSFLFWCLVWFHLVKKHTLYGFLIESFYFYFFLFIRDTERQRHRQRGAPPVGGPMQDSVPGPRDHSLSQRQKLNHWATQVPLNTVFITVLQVTNEIVL